VSNLRRQHSSTLRLHQRRTRLHHQLRHQGPHGGWAVPWRRGGGRL